MHRYHSRDFNSPCRTRGEHDRNCSLITLKQKRRPTCHWADYRLLGFVMERTCLYLTLAINRTIFLRQCFAVECRLFVEAEIHFFSLWRVTGVCHHTWSWCVCVRDRVPGEDVRARWSQTPTLISARLSKL